MGVTFCVEKQNSTNQHCLFTSGTPFPGRLSWEECKPPFNIVVPFFFFDRFSCLTTACCSFSFRFVRTFSLPPPQYSKAVDFDQLEKAGGKVVTCVFKDDGRVLSVFAKRARGLFARHVVVNRAGGVADLEAFSAEGYGLDRSQSGDGVLVFTRSKAQRAAAVPAKPAATKTKTKTITSTAAEAKAKPKATASSSTAAAARGRKRAAPATAAAAAGTAAERKEAASGGGDTDAATARGKRAAPSTGRKSAAKAKPRKKT